MLPKFENRLHWHFYFFIFLGSLVFVFIIIIIILFLGLTQMSQTYVLSSWTNFFGYYAFQTSTIFILSFLLFFFFLFVNFIYLFFFFSTSIFRTLNIWNINVNGLPNKSVSFDLFVQFNYAIFSYKFGKIS